ncbi:MAG: lipid A biosynthesis acyltransferase [Thiotrichales bacterium]|nr:lipid A biosynthesis acyltransferase [Thiotrichales bacterium]
MGRVLSACFLSAMRGVARMPWGIQRRIGGTAGGLMHCLMRRRRRIAETNLALCFPHLGDAARARLVRRHFHALGLGIVETALAWWGSEPRIMARSRIVGAEHLEAALACGRGVILLGGHFTTFELSGRILASRFECGATYRPHNDPGWDALLRAGRGRHLAALVPHKDARAMIRHLAGNRILWYAPDQDFSSRRGRRNVFVPFFAERSAATTATAWLARTSGARVVPFASYRLADESGWEVVIGPALQDFPSGDDVADATRLNAVLERQIERSPEQYLWVHRRFKTRPPDAPPAYGAELLRHRTTRG